MELIDLNAKIEIRNGTLVITDFETDDDEIVSYFSDVSPEKLEERLKTSLKVGVVSLKTIGTTERIDYIEKEFYKLKQEFGKSLEETASELEKQFGVVFGEDGTFSKIIEEHFGENGKLVKQIFDPVIEGTPLYNLRIQIMKKMEELRTDFGIKKAVEEVVEVTPKKGFEFEDVCESLLGDIVKAHLGDELVRTTDVIGRIRGSKKGDFLITVNARPDCRIVLETKDVQSITLPKIHGVMKEALENRDAKYGIFLTKWAESLPKGVGCFNEYQGNHLVCSLTSKQHEGILHPEILHIAVCWAKIRSLSEMAEAEGLNVSLIQTKLEEIRNKLKLFARIKSECTNVQKSVRSIRSLSDEIRDGIKIELGAIRDEIVRVMKENTS